MGESVPQAAGSRQRPPSDPPPFGGPNLWASHFFFRGNPNLVDAPLFRPRSGKQPAPGGGTIKSEGNRFMAGIRPTPYHHTPVSHLIWRTFALKSGRWAQTRVPVNEYQLSAYWVQVFPRKEVSCPLLISF